MEMSLIQMFQDRGCLQIEETDKFVYASGLSGPIYCDNRMVLGCSKLRDAVTTELLKSLKKSNLKFDGILAMATGGIAIGAILSHELSLPFGYVRSQRKVHGRGALIEGKVPTSAKILVFEDLINQGSSVIKGYQVLINAGYNVSGIMSIVNYEFEASASFFRSENVPVLSVIGFSDLLNHFEITESNPSKLKSLVDWHNRVGSKSLGTS